MQIHLLNLKKGNIEVHPDPQLLKIIQNKWDQKYMLHKMDLKNTNNVFY